jgi:hypothetical protein
VAEELQTHAPLLKDARADGRYEIDAYVDLTLGETRSHPIQNISLGGICIQTKQLDEVGSLVDVILKFPELGREIAMRGQVVWANRTPPPDVGIRWVDLDESRRSLLNEYIDRVRTREQAKG